MAGIHAAAGAEDAPMWLTRTFCSNVDAPIPRRWLSLTGVTIMTKSMFRFMCALAVVAAFLAPCLALAAGVPPVGATWEVAQGQSFIDGARIVDGSPVRLVGTSGGTWYVKGYTAAAPSSALTASMLICQFELADGVSVRVLHDGYAVEASAIVGTADVLVFRREAGDIFSARCVIQGDVLGTGIMSLSQLVRMAGAYRGTQSLRGAFLVAADFTGSGGVNLSDLVGESRLYKRSLSARPTATSRP